MLDEAYALVKYFSSHRYTNNVLFPSLLNTLQNDSCFSIFLFSLFSEDEQLEGRKQAFELYKRRFLHFEDGLWVYGL